MAISPRSSFDSKELINAPSQSARSTLHVSITPLTYSPSLARSWRDLEQRSHGSFFTSWNWISPWLDSIPKVIPLLQVEARRDNCVVGLGILAAPTESRFGLLKRPSLRLHETGLSELDRLTIEHNGFLTDARWSAEIAHAMATTVLSRSDQAERLFVSGVDLSSTEWINAISASNEWTFRWDKVRPCYAVNIAQLKANNSDYLSQLGHKTRAQIRRSQRLYAERGPLQIHQVKTTTEGKEWFARFCQLHTKQWQARGETGAFANASVIAFHKELIEVALPTGGVQLLEVRAGDSRIGMLYNFQWHGHIYAYQSAIEYEENPHLKPGMVCHVMAIQQALAEGHTCYDFLAGDSRYKRSLSTTSTAVGWLIADRRTYLNDLENLLRHAKQTLVHNNRTAAGLDLPQ